MTNLYQRFKKLSKDEILDLGRYYAVDANGFTKFVEENWNEKQESSCDYVRALITVVTLLNDRPMGSEHEITVLNDFFNDTTKEKNKLVNALDKYFNEAGINKDGYDIVKAYQEKISARKNARSLFDELQNLSFSKVGSIFTPERIKRLKRLNNTYAYVSTVIDGEIKTPKLRKIYIRGNDAKTLILKMGKANYRFVGIKRGIYNISNEYKELMFQNNVSYNDKYSPLEKVAYIYGIDEAKKYVRQEIHNMTDVQDEIYHEKRKGHKTLNEYLKEND